MVVPFAKFTTKKWVVLASKIDQLFIGVGIIIAGVALAIWGYNIYNAASLQITRTLSGDTPIEAWTGMVGGVIAALIGVTRLK